MFVTDVLLCATLYTAISVPSGEREIGFGTPEFGVKLPVSDQMTGVPAIGVTCLAVAEGFQLFTVPVTVTCPMVAPDPARVKSSGNVEEEVKEAVEGKLWITFPDGSE